MKIGLEFEGVIHDFQTGNIVRWSKIEKAKQSRIQRILYANREAVLPCDRYDALAEVRTLPIENPTPEKLIKALFSEMELASHAFSANGYDIHWFEEPIPVELHDEIRKDFAADDPDGKKDKFTWTVKDFVATQFQGAGNLFRGGGLHINVSSIPHVFAQMVAENLHGRLSCFNLKSEFQSHYRNNILYRVRQDYTTNDNIVEYMSHGFNVQSLSNWRTDFSHFCQIDDHYKRIYGEERDLRFNWAWAMIDQLGQFYKDIKSIK